MHKEKDYSIKIDPLFTNNYKSLTSEEKSKFIEFMNYFEKNTQAIIDLSQELESNKDIKYFQIDNNVFVLFYIYTIDKTVLLFDILLKDIKMLDINKNYDYHKLIYKYIQRNFIKQLLGLIVSIIGIILITLFLYNSNKIINFILNKNSNTQEILTGVTVLIDDKNSNTQEILTGVTILIDNSPRPQINTGNNNITLIEYIENQVSNGTQGKDYVLITQKKQPNLSNKEGEKNNEIMRDYMRKYKYIISIPEGVTGGYIVFQTRKSLNEQDIFLSIDGISKGLINKQKILDKNELNYVFDLQSFPMISRTKSGTRVEKNINLLNFIKNGSLTIGGAVGGGDNGIEKIMIIFNN